MNLFFHRLQFNLFGSFFFIKEPFFFLSLLEKKVYNKIVKDFYNKKENYMKSLRNLPNIFKIRKVVMEPVTRFFLNENTQCFLQKGKSISIFFLPIFLSKTRVFAAELICQTNPQLKPVIKATNSVLEKTETVFFVWMEWKYLRKNISVKQFESKFLSSLVQFAFQEGKQKNALFFLPSTLSNRYSLHPVLSFEPKGIFYPLPILNFGPFTPQGALPKSANYLWVKTKGKAVLCVILSTLVVKKIVESQLFEKGVPILFPLVDENSPGGPPDDDPFSRHFLFAFFLKHFWKINPEDFSRLSLASKYVLLEQFKVFLLIIQMVTLFGGVAMAYLSSKLFTSFIFQVIEKFFEIERLNELEEKFPNLPILPKEDIGKKGKAETVKEILVEEKTPVIKTKEETWVGRKEKIVPEKSGKEIISSFEKDKQLVPIFSSSQTDVSTKKTIKNVGKNISDQVVSSNLLKDSNLFSPLELALEKFESLFGNSSTEEEKSALRGVFGELEKIFPKDMISFELDKILENLNRTYFHE